MSMPEPKEGTVRHYYNRYDEVFEVYSKGKWEELVSQQAIDEALADAPVVIAGKPSQNPSGEQIKLPPPDGGK